MKSTRLRIQGMVMILAVSAAPGVSAAQQPPTPAGEHQHHTVQGGAPLVAPRDASGTSWLPDETPMYGAHRTWRGWDVMLHGAAYVQFLYEPGDIHRTGGFSEGQASSVNWAMVMARRTAGAGRTGFRAMVSLEPWTVGDCGFINLLASGEVCDGDTIHDRQHPHDLLMELSADYDRPIRGSTRWQIYAGLSGEPALGPAGFPHRVSAASNPVAPIGHHWLDSTHITAGLVTTGLYGQKWKAELSVFNGREPDENRADLDLAALDSVSGRVTVLPTPRLALQVSAGRLREAEAALPPEPRGDLKRMTASATYHRATDELVWATTLAYGLNAASDAIAGVGTFHPRTSAVLLESSLTRDERHAWFGRGEIVQKPAHDLHAHEWIDRVFTVGKLQAGYARLLAPTRGMVLGAGGFVSVSLVPQELTNRYLRRAAPGFGIFLSLRPARHAAQ
jgi:hypothetical protein